MKKRMIYFSMLCALRSALCGLLLGAMLFALCAPLAQAQKANNITSPAKVSGVASPGKVLGVTFASGSSFTDDFGGTLSAWTQILGTWATTGGYASSTLADTTIASLAYSTAVTGGTNQAIEIMFPAKGTGNTGGGVALRAQNLLATSDSIAVAFSFAGGVIQLYKCTDPNTPTQVGSDCTATVNVTHYYGVKISGPATAINVYVYDNGTSSAWSTRNTWASPICSWTGQDVSAGYTYGDYMGVWLWQDTASEVHIDNWHGGNFQ